MRAGRCAGRCASASSRWRSRASPASPRSPASILFERGESDGKPAWRLLTRNTVDASQQLDLSPWQLPELLGVLVVDVAPGSGANAAPSSLAALPNPFADDSAVAVPVVPEVC